MQGGSLWAAQVLSWENHFDSLIVVISLSLLVLFLLFKYLSHRINATVSGLAHSGMIMLSLWIFLEASHHATLANSMTERQLDSTAIETHKAIDQSLPIETIPISSVSLKKKEISEVKPQKADDPVSFLKPKTSATDQSSYEENFVNFTLTKTDPTPGSNLLPEQSTDGDACTIKLAHKVNRKRKYGGVKWDSRRLSKYDRHFQKYTQRFFNDKTDWRWFKVQAFVESGMRQGAVSTAGAVGIMQILPSTFRQIQRMNSLFRGKSIHNPEWNIAAGIYYNSYLWEQWLNQEAPSRHLQLMFASYNSGLGRMTRIVPNQNQNDSGSFEKLHRLPKETRHYITKITYHMEQLRGAAFVHPNEFCREVTPFDPLHVVAIT